MNVMAKVQDSATIDARNRDARRQSNASSDGSSHFDEALSDAQTTKSSDTKSSDTAAKPDAASPNKTVPANDQTAVAPGDVIQMDALLELLGKGTTTKAPTVDGAPVKDAKEVKETGKGKGDDTDGGSVDSMLQSMAAKDAALAAGQADATGPAAATATPTSPPSGDLVSLLMLGAAATPATVDATSSQAAASAKKSVATAVPGARDMPLDGTDHTAAKETIVSNVTIETHLAPAAPNNAASLTNGHKGSKQDAPASETVSASAPDGAAQDAGAQDVAALGLDATSQITGAMSAPVRSIATALVDLASRADTPSQSAPVPIEQSKTTLGVARTMTLQMNPANLGTVDIRMHMTGQTLDVQLSVSDPRTLGLVNRERDSLATALSDQNYALNSLVIQDGGAAASSGGNNATSQGDTSGSQARSERQSAGYGADGQGGNRSPGQGAGRGTGDDQSTSDAAPYPTSSSRGSSLFV